MKAKRTRKPQIRRQPGERAPRKFDPSIGKATQFQPGQSGNPGGRPKKDVAAEIAQMIFEKNYEGIYNAMCKSLMKGNPKVFSALADRGYGKPKETVEVKDERSFTLERVGELIRAHAQQSGTENDNEGDQLLRGRIVRQVED